QLATAQLTYDSNKELFDNAVISAYELQMAENKLSETKAALAQANAQLTTASNNLSYTLVKSPVNGVAGMIPYRVGALVSSSINEALVTVSDDSFINAYFSLSENLTLDFMQQYGSQEAFIKGMPEVSLKLGNGRDYPKKGRIGAVSGIVDKSTGAVRMRARFDNSEHLLRSGGNANVIIPTDIKNCILIPQSATYEIQERIFVYKVIDGKAVSTRVEVYKYNDGSNYVVESGLSEGDVIIAEGAGLIKEGTPVKAE
ncbi:MAG: efflux RND transporter periplasmic adaptor subunit, partial [Alistipes sp.]|nr:efflux RND transporter periplasmic adaptor subunit [Candidatus Minthomonas equi]